MQVAFAGMVTLNVFVPLWLTFVSVNPAGRPNLSARTGCVGDQTGLSMKAGVHCFAEPAAPSVGGREARHRLRRAGALLERDAVPAGMSDCCRDLHGNRLSRGCTLVTTAEAAVPVVFSFPHGGVF